MHDKKPLNGQSTHCHNSINSNINTNTTNSTSKKQQAEEKKDEGKTRDNNKPIDTNISSVSTMGNLVKAAPQNYCQRRTFITTERMHELKRQAQEAVKQNKTFTIRGCFNSVRNSLLTRGWVEKLDAHRKHIYMGVCQVTYDELTQTLPKRKPGETRRQYVQKCEKTIMSRFLEHLPIDFLWTNRKEKCDYIDLSRNPGLIINKFHRAPFTSKEGLCLQLKDFHWFYEEGTSEMYFPRCFNVWSPEELLEFVDNFKLTACIAFLHIIVENYCRNGFDAVFSPTGKIPFSIFNFAYKRCSEYIDSCQHNDIDVEDNCRVWEHEWDNFLHQQQYMVNEGGKIIADTQRIIEHLIRNSAALLDRLKIYWPQYTLDGYQNLWIVKPANKCRGRGIQLMDNLKKILNLVNPSVASKSRFVVQKYIERPLIIHQTKFDIRQWFMVTNVQPLVIWMYKESYLRFSSQEYSLSNHHESVHLTNHAIQKKYTNAKRDKRLPTENMWDCYTFQAYLRQIGKQEMWIERIYPGMRKAIIGTMLASQENMDRRPNSFELFGADFMICEDFYPWLIEINSSPDLGATTSVTARMCPQCLEDVIKVTVDRRIDPKADTGNFELIYRQVVPATPAYMGLNLCVRGKQIISRVTPNYNYYYPRRERGLSTNTFVRPKTHVTTSHIHKEMPIFNATEYVEKSLSNEIISSSRSNNTNIPDTMAISPRNVSKTFLSLGNISTRKKQLLPDVRIKDCNGSPKVCGAKNQALAYVKRRRSCGPRLQETSNENINSHLKFMVRKCVLQKSPGLLLPSHNLRGQSECVSKSESNIIELLNHVRPKVLPNKNNLCPPGSEKLPIKEIKAYTLSAKKSKSMHSLSRIENSGGEPTNNMQNNMQAVGKSLSCVKVEKKDAVTAVVRRLTAPIHMCRRNYGNNCANEDKDGRSKKFINREKSD